MITFAIRSNQLKARYAPAGAEGVGWASSSSDSFPSVVADSSTGLIGSSVIDMDAGAGKRGLFYTGGDNCSGTVSFSILARYIPRFSGTPAATASIVKIINVASGPGQIALSMFPNGRWNWFLSDERGSTYFSFATAAMSSLTLDTAHDILFTYDGTLTSGNAKVYLDGVLVEAGSPGRTYEGTTGISGRENGNVQSIILSGDTFIPDNNWDLNEFVIWDSVIDPTSVALTSGVGSLSGASRAAFVDIGTLDGLDNTDPGSANVTLGTSWTFQGNTLNGTIDLSAACVIDFSDLIGLDEFASIRPYFQAIMNASGFREWKDGFNSDNIPANLLDGAYHIEIGIITGISNNQSDLVIEFPVIVRFFKKGFRDPQGAIDTSLQAGQSIIQKALKPTDRLNQTNFKNITFETMVPSPVQESNDNALVMEMNFKALIELKP